MIHNRFVATIFLVLLTLPVQLIAASSRASNDAYLARGEEATQWILGFAVSPPETGLGIPYFNGDARNSSKAWGLDPFFIENGTITAGISGIKAGEEQKKAFLIGGHDSGEAGWALLNAYIYTRQEKYLRAFKEIYLEYFQRSQMPSTFVDEKPVFDLKVGNRTFSIDNRGFWAEQANLESGPDGTFGTIDDVVRLVSPFPAAEHGNPIALSLIVYHDLTGDRMALEMLNKYGDWLVRTQVKDEIFTYKDPLTNGSKIVDLDGAFPVTQSHRYRFGWAARMYETSESAWVLFELSRITGNTTYLGSALKAADFMLKVQYTSDDIKEIRGSLPQIWRSGESLWNPNPLTNHAGFTLMTWALAYQHTGEKKYLYGSDGDDKKANGGALAYADWLLSWQTTPPSTRWGTHEFSDDGYAIGGFFYGYDLKTKSRPSFLEAQAIWSASFSIIGLTALAEITKNVTYTDSARLAADWLMRMRYDDQGQHPFQALSSIRYHKGTWWGLYPQFYLANSSKLKEIRDFVVRGLANPEQVTKSPTYFERAVGVDFDKEALKAAAKGEQSRRLLWAWWPSLGFEPRYGGDVALGLFTFGFYDLIKSRIDATEKEVMSLTFTVSAINNLTKSETQLAAKLSRAQSLLDEAHSLMQFSQMGLAYRRIIEAGELSLMVKEGARSKAILELEKTSSLIDLARGFSWLTASSGEQFQKGRFSLQESRSLYDQADYARAVEKAVDVRESLSRALAEDAIMRNLIIENLTKKAGRLEVDLQKSTEEFNSTIQKIGGIFSEKDRQRLADIDTLKQETNQVRERTEDALVALRKNLSEEFMQAYAVSIAATALGTGALLLHIRRRRRA